MTSKSKNSYEGSDISIIDAVETLSDIADLEILPEVGIAKKHNFIVGDYAVTYRSVQWLHTDDIEVRLQDLREIFKVILVYLKDFYKKKNKQLDNDKNIEGIKNIMVLVGEAAKKLDRFQSIFHHSVNAKNVTDWKEYKQLQDFYLHRIAKHIDEGVLSKWILGLAQKTFPGEQQQQLTVEEKNLQTKHIFVDLEAVKKDSEYELFFMRKEDGSRFYSPRLIRNIKLVCDFGDSVAENKVDDPLSDLIVWKDRCLHACAKDLYASLTPTIKEFYEVGIKYKDREIVESIRKCIMALVLGGNEHHLYRNSPPKSCLEYFNDFQLYLRQTLKSRAYQNLIAYPPQGDEKIENCILQTVQALCYGLYSVMKGYREMIVPLQAILREAKQEISPEHLEAANTNQLWNRLGCDHAALAKLIKRHANGPLIKVLNLLEENDSHIFDPLIQGNMPSLLYSLYFNEKKVDCLHLPSPTNQEQIDKVSVLEEFKTFLNSLKKRNGKHLLINMQDRTSWREYTRCKILEEMQMREDFEDQLVVVTLPKDTEFYHQQAPYLNDKHAQNFLKNLKKQISENIGFFLPKNIKKQLSASFLDDLSSAILRIFFHNKNVLLQEHRLDFIELFYVFLQLKIIEIVQPTSFSISCKDCVDIGSSSSAEVYAVLKLLNEEKLSEEEINYLNVLIYSAPILVRERLIAPERFKRMLSTIKVFEASRQEQGQLAFLKTVQETLGHLYKTNILESLVIIPKEDHLNL